jgi:hypothetical protein
MKPIAVPTFGGMITCTVTNLILAPVMFSLFYQMEHWFIRRRRTGLETDDGTIPEPIREQGTEDSKHKEPDHGSMTDEEETEI